MELKNLEDLAKIIDHTNLKAFSTTDDIKQLCDEAKEYSFGAVCINPVNVKLAKEYLEGTDVKVCTVIGFPLGATTSEVKAFEAEQAIDNGATEVDMVINIGALKSKNYAMVKDDISAVVNVVSKKAKEKNTEIICKVILETCYLSDEEIIKACELAKEAKADFVKTSTGFGTGGAKPEHIKIMRQTVGDKMGVKASGGIRSFEAAKEMVEAGASRIGASSSVKIMEEFKEYLKSK